jgi:ABC-type Fe3+/spermidine/putrescine transport system ATPase subunit
MKIRATKLSKNYGSVRALNDVSFEISSTQHTAIIGPSGSGKSTLLKLIAGLEESSGEIHLDETIASKMDKIVVPPHKRSMSMVFQDLALWPNLTVMQNVNLGLTYAGLSREEKKQTAEWSLENCQISKLAHRKPIELSGGQQQRVALARALATRPSFLLLDEPFSGLDLLIKRDLLKAIRKIADEKSITLIVVTHDPFEARDLCDRALVLEEGRISEHGNFKELFLSPKSKLLLAFREQVREFDR